MKETDFMAYEGAFPDSKICIDAPSGDVLAIDYTTGESHVMPEEETQETFHDRLQRSMSCGRTLFFEEWPVLKRDWSDTDRIY